MQAAQGLPIHYDNQHFFWHPASSGDQAAMTAMRAMVEPNKGRMRGICARAAYDGIIERVAPPEGVEFRQDNVGGLAGWWCTPEGARPGEVILHLHGGWFNWGTAQAFRKLVGQIAKSTGVPAFVPDYRLAPEHPFPTAVEDVRTCYRGLVGLGFRVALTGDSAGGNLALQLLASESEKGTEAPVAAVVLSPVTDLTLSGASWETRAAADPFFVRDQAQELVDSYLKGHNPADALASPLFGELKGLPPVRLHVGNDEVLRDDSLRYADRAVQAGVDAQVHVWEAMAHGFLSGVGRMDASTQALAATGEFLTTQFKRLGNSSAPQRKER